MAWVTAWLWPARTAERTQHVSLISAWVVHFVAGVMAFLFAVGLATWLDGRSFALTPAEMIRVIARGLEEIYRELRLPPIVAGMVLTGIAVFVELEFAVLALVMAPWGARDEPLRDTIKNGLRRTWLHTAVLPWGIVTFAAVVIPLQSPAREWNRNQPTPAWPAVPTFSNLSPDDPGYQKAMDDYQAAMAEYNLRAAEVSREWAAIRARTPWYVRHAEPLTLMLGFGMTLWWLWSLFRFVGGPREVTAMARPPLCETCGYNLTTMGMEGRCPECGEGVAASLGVEGRPGTAWDRRNTVGRVTAWWHCAGEAVRRPARLGRTIRTGDSATDHRGFFALHLPVIFLAGAAGLLGFGVTVGANFWAEGLTMPCIIACVFGSVCVMGTAMFMQTAATLVGGYLTIREKRNLLAGSMRIGCYLTPYLLAWEVFGAATGCAAIGLSEGPVFEVVESMTGIKGEFAAFLSWFILNAAWGVWYLVLLYRGTAGTRYANR